MKGSPPASRTTSAAARRTAGRSPIPLLPAVIAKLDVLARGLYARPELQLVIEGSTNPQTDLEAFVKALMETAYGCLRIVVGSLFAPGVFGGSGLPAIAGWLKVLVGFDLIFVLLCYSVFQYVVEESN